MNPSGFYVDPVLVRSTAQLYGVIEHQLQVWIGRLVIQVIKWTDD